MKQWVKEDDYYSFGRVIYKIPQNDKEILQGLNTTGHVTEYGGKVFIGKYSKGNKELPSGPYEYIHWAGEHKIIPMKIEKQKYIQIECIEKEIMDDVNIFLKAEDVYKKIGTTYKRGYLLYGPAGTGKTSLINNVIQSFSKHALIIFLKAIPSSKVAAMLNKEDRLKIFVIEEITEMVMNKTAALLNFLDGATSVSKSITFATTNHAGDLPGNIVNRPSRFDYVKYIGNPNREGVKKIAEFYLGGQISEEDLDLLEGNPTSIIKEVCLQKRIRKMDIKAYLSRLKSRMELAKKDFGEEKKHNIGFSNHIDYDDW